MAFIDYYKIMGIPRDTPQKDIRLAFKKRAKQFHPDLHPDDPKAKAKFQALMTQRSVESTINMVSTGEMQILLIKQAVFMQVLMAAMASKDLILVSFLGEEAFRHSLKTCLEEVLTLSDVRAMKLQ